MALKKILFLTGTRADFGKMKSLIRGVQADPGFESIIFVTGMHALARYGYTVDEVYRCLEDGRLSDGFRNVHVFMNQNGGEPMERILANTIQGFSRYVAELAPDLIVVHGDRVEALAGATVGALRNILVAHIEGGEISGTVDEIIRHSVTKLSHIHFTANEVNAARLRQMGEHADSIFIIGSPDIDIMLSDTLPNMTEVNRYYDIPFDSFGVALLHPVTTNLQETSQTVKAMIESMHASGHNYVVIYPNNDLGAEIILDAYKHLHDFPNFKIFPSMRLEYFLTLLRNAQYIIGNSSTGIHEAPVYGVRTINIANRQHNRFCHESINNVPADSQAIISAIQESEKLPACTPSFHFGTGNSSKLFMNALSDERLWKIQKQKQFIDI